MARADQAGAFAAYARAIAAGGVVWVTFEIEWRAASGGRKPPEKRGGAGSVLRGLTPPARPSVGANVGPNLRVGAFAAYARDIATRGVVWVTFENERRTSGER